jgi:hemoglobin/transferrin/lactoferrin receptor protein
MKKFLVLYTLAFYQLSYTQVLTVLDAKNQPIIGVMVTSENPKFSNLTDTLGKVDISFLKNSKVIQLMHENFETISYSYAQLEEMEFEVILNKKKFTINEVVISASRWQQKRTDSPNRIETIDMKEAAFQNPQTTADLLGMSGYAFIQKSQMGGGSPMIRGMATNRLLIVVDGVRMNTAIFRSGNLQNVISLDANAMESAEILFGPSSVMYGSDAIGGVMNFQTLQPKFLESFSEKKLKVIGNAFSRFSTANQEKTQHLDFNVQLKKISFLSNLTYADYDDLRSGSKKPIPDFYRRNYVITYDNQDFMVPNMDSTLQVGSKYSQWNFMQKVRWMPNQFWDIDLAYHFSQTSSYNRYDRLYVMQTSGPYKGKLRWAEWYYGPQKWQMHRLGIQYSKANRFFHSMNLVFAYQFFEESRYDREFMFRELRMQKENVDAYSLNLDFEKMLNQKITLHYGMETVYNRVKSQANLTHVVTKKVTPTATRYPNGSLWLSNGAYCTIKFKPDSQWVFSSGVRVNSFQIDAKFDTTFFPFPYQTARLNTTNISGSLGAVYLPKHNWNFYINLTNGFRSPNIDDMAKVFESVPGYLVVPNPNLKPEKVFNVEFGTIKTLSSFLKLDATVYHTWLYDAMVRKDFVFNGDTTIRYLGNKSRIQAIQNVTQIQVYGFQAGIEFFYKGFGIKSNYSYQKGREQAPDSLVYYPLRHAAPNFGSTHITYETIRFKGDFYVVYNAKMDYKDLALTERVNASYARDKDGRPYVASWFTLNFKIAFFPKNHISIALGLENILDRMYRPYASGINAPGRNFIASLRVKF